MRAQDFIKYISRYSGVHPDVVKDVLAAIPRSLWHLRLKEGVNTPLGRFTAKFQKGRWIKPPITKEGTQSEYGWKPHKVIIQLKPLAIDEDDEKFVFWFPNGVKEPRPPEPDS